MSNAGNLDTALIYLKAGMKDRAYECLCNMLDGLAKEEQVASNKAYLRALVITARLQLERNNRSECIRCIDQGLELDPNHADFLFLKALVYWDQGKFDDMFLTLVTYLSVLTSGLDKSFEYEYTSEKTIVEVLHRLIPEAFEKSPNRVHFFASVQAMAQRGSQPLINKLAEVLTKVNHSIAKAEQRERGEIKSKS